MHVIMFAPRFVPLVESRRKMHTIRPPRRRPIRPGDPLSLRCWTGLPYRSPQREIGQGMTRSVENVYFDRSECSIDGVRLSDREWRRLAVSDGFKSLTEMLAWHEAAHGLPVDATLIRWI